MSVQLRCCDVTPAVGGSPLPNGTNTSRSRCRVLSCRYVVTSTRSATAVAERQCAPAERITLDILVRIRDLDRWSIGRSEIRVRDVAEPGIVRRVSFCPRAQIVCDFPRSHPASALYE